MSLEETQPLLNPSITPEDCDSAKGDARPRFTISQSCRRKIAGSAILMTVMLERMAFYSITSNLYLYLNHKPLDWLPYSAMTASYVFTGVAYLTGIIGGWLADSVLGKFKAVLLGLLIYCGGYSLLTFMSSYDQEIPDICFLGSKLIPFSNISNPETWVDRSVLDLHAVQSDYNLERRPSINDDEQTFRNLNTISGGREICDWLVYLILIVIGFSVALFRPNIAPFGADQVLHRLHFSTFHLWHCVYILNGFPMFFYVVV